MSRSSFAFVLALVATLVACDVAPAAPRSGTTIPANAPPTIDARPWPRTYTVDGTQFQLFRPQLDSWTGDRLTARAVMAVKTGTADQQTLGVLWLSARTETDKDALEVTLTDIAVDRDSFPGARTQEAAYLALARK